MELKIKFLKWSAGIPVAMLHNKTAKVLGVHPKDRIIIKNNFSSKGKIKHLSAAIDTISEIVKEDEIAVTSEIKDELGLKMGQKVDISLAPIPKSMAFIKKKLLGKELNEFEIKTIIEDIVDNYLAEAEIAMFVSAVFDKGMTLKETVYLIKGIMRTGSVLKLKSKMIVDKHCVGGVPGNRTTPIIVPICASAGLIMPKSSSRAITSAAGTADVIETLAKVEFTSEELKKIVKKTNACLVWGGGLGMVPADEKIIRIEKSLTLDPQAQLLASIMSKKLAVGSNYILIDIPQGEFAKVKKETALYLKKKFEEIGKYFHRKVRVVLTDGNHPIGQGIGPALEMKDVLKVLRNSPDRPIDLENKALFLTGEILEMTGKAAKGKGFEMAKEILYSGKAFEKFKQIIEAQGGKVKELGESKFKKDVFAEHSGRLKRVDNRHLKYLAITSGCQADKFAGVFLHVKEGDEIKKGQKLATIYAESPSRINEAVKFCKENNPFIMK